MTPPPFRPLPFFIYRFHRFYATTSPNPETKYVEAQIPRSGLDLGGSRPCAMSRVQHDADFVSYQGRRLPRGRSISKALSKILRHRAARLGVNIRPDGFVLAEELLALDQFESIGFTLSDLNQAVRSNDKKRFELRDEEGQVWIRAVQGHSIDTVRDECLLQPLAINDPDLPQVCVHGTYRGCLDSILDQGLISGGRSSRRKHIHFVPFEPGDERIVSGMRRDCQLAVYIDLAAALREGVPFFRSVNNVILSPGVRGVLPAKFILKVKDLQTGRMTHYICA